MSIGKILEGRRFEIFEEIFYLKFSGNLGLIRLGILHH